MDPEIAKEMLLDHYRNPRNYGKIENPSSEITDNNPVCGDTVHISVQVKDGMIADIKFVGQGCSISQASASILTEYVKGKKVSEALSITESSFIELIGFPLGPNREKCALLSLNALRKALNSAE